mmetsp:Transcript_8442/g.11380  ORF Transcript_8442/g.11380 Transcript_8442/m.11380 type:complete len:211 (+) Transcript_8442:86-718(+)
MARLYFGYLSILSEITAADTPSYLRPSKIRGVALPSDYELVCFIQNISNADSSWVPERPACEWAGVYCNARQEVTEVNWGGKQLRGTPRWQHLPETLLSLDLGERSGECNHLCGEVDFCALSSKITGLSLELNKFSGELDLASLPQTLVDVFLQDNLFSGEVEFTSLPFALQRLDLSGNSELRGVLHRNKIPTTVSTIWIEGTKIRLKRD